MPAQSDCGTFTQQKSGMATRSRRVVNGEQNEENQSDGNSETGQSTSTPGVSQEQMMDFMRTFLTETRELERRERAEIEEERRRERNEFMNFIKTMQDNSQSSVVDVRLTRLEERDDIEAYLTTFERTMDAHSINRGSWAYRLAPYLTGRAQQAFAAMDKDDSSNYDLVKESILKHYDITTTTYQQRFRGIKKRTNESFREMAVRMKDLVTKWTRDCRTVDDVCELLMVEQFQNVVNGELCIQLKERGVKTISEAAELADNFVVARRTHTHHSGPPTCLRCGRIGHLAKDCRTVIPRTGPTGNHEKEANTNGRNVDANGRRNDVKCFRCGKMGHLSYKCTQAFFLVSHLLASTHDEQKTEMCRRG